MDVRGDSLPGRGEDVLFSFGATECVLFLLDRFVALCEQASFCRNRFAASLL